MINKFEVGQTYSVIGSYDVLYIVLNKRKEMVLVKFLDTGAVVDYPVSVLKHSLQLADVTEQMWEEQKVFDMQDKQH